MSSITRQQAVTAGVAGGAAPLTAVALGRRRSGVPMIETGAGPGAGPQFKVFRRSDMSVLEGFLVGDPAFDGGVYVG